jgi:hypothetical protein
MSRCGREPRLDECTQSNAGKAMRAHRIFGAAARLGTGKKRKGAVRHKRFLEMAREVEASEDSKDFENAFTKVVSPHRRAEKAKET